jgi:cytochrome P450
MHSVSTQGVRDFSVALPLTREFTPSHRRRFTAAPSGQPTAEPTKGTLVTRTDDASTATRASLGDTARTVMNVLAPTLAGGVIARRPHVFGLADRLNADLRAVHHMQQLAERYGPGPVRLAVPGRSFALVLSPEHVHRVLSNSPEPFALANLEKRAALAHFQPHGVLISHGRQRTVRRAFNEAVLDTGHQIHRMAEPITVKVREEAEQLAAIVAVSGTLNSDQFVAAWWRVIRRVVLGDAARDDHEISDLLTRLRREANWGYLAPRRAKVYDKFKQRLRGYLHRAEAGSLAGLVADTPASADTDPEDQLPQWLFAYDPAGLVTIRALALLASHSEHAEQVRAEIRDANLSAPQPWRGLRASVLESARLWPTTPAVLRDTTTETQWPSGTLPAGTGLLIYAPFFHRNDRTLPYAHRFAPEIWLDEQGHGDWPLIPFSEGPGVCPGQNLVLLTASTFLATLLDKHRYTLQHAERLDPDRPLPATFSPYRLRFDAQPNE